jgi:FKBP-type peptidyl-prolyl cis-trans isomerase
MNIMKRMSLFFLVVLLFACDDKDNNEFDFDGQLQKDIATIDKYILTNNIQAYKDLRGIRFEIISLGTGGLPPKLEHTVKINLTGKYLANGAVFYPTAENNKIVSTFEAAGLQMALTLLPKGTKARIFVPSGLAYGEFGNDPIPANANLIYEVELLDITRPSSEVGQLTNDIQAIDTYLADHSIAATEDPSGIRYTIETPGTGDLLTWYDKVKITYTGKVLNTGTEFFSGTSEPTDVFNGRVVDYIQGLMVGLQKLSKGGKATFYIPSSLGFGNVPAGNGKVPGNSNLVYQVEIVDVNP